MLMADCSEMSVGLVKDEKRKRSKSTPLSGIHYGYASGPFSGANSPRPH